MQQIHAVRLSPKRALCCQVYLFFYRRQQCVLSHALLMSERMRQSAGCTTLVPSPTVP
jgi:hypothetical protein